jgi:hypothetical protein
METNPYRLKTSLCGHEWDVQVPNWCTKKTMPSCACGGPLETLSPGCCPACGHLPGFLEIPLWIHTGGGVYNVKSVMKLQLSSAVGDVLDNSEPESSDGVDDLPD